MSALVPYAGSERKWQGRQPALASALGPYNETRALRLFRQGHDNISIAWLLACTPAAAANALARARDRERSQ